MGMPLKHIDISTPPNEELLAVWKALKAGEFASLALWANLAYVVAWAVAWIGNKPDEPLIVGDDRAWNEFYASCADVTNWANEDSVPVPKSAIGAWIVKAALIAILNRIIAELASNGDLPEWLREVLDAIKSAIEGL